MICEKDLTGTFYLCAGWIKQVNNFWKMQQIIYYVKKKIYTWVLKKINSGLI